MNFMDLLRTRKLLPLWRKIAGELRTSMKVTSGLNVDLPGWNNPYKNDEETEFTCGSMHHNVCQDVYLRMSRKDGFIDIKIEIFDNSFGINREVNRVLNQVLLEKTTGTISGYLESFSADQVGQVTHKDVTDLCIKAIKKAEQLNRLLKETSEERERIKAQFKKLDNELLIGFRKKIRGSVENIPTE